MSICKCRQTFLDKELGAFSDMREQRLWQNTYCNYYVRAISWSVSRGFVTKKWETYFMILCNIIMRARETKRKKKKLRERKVTMHTTWKNYYLCRGNEKGTDLSSFIRAISFLVSSWSAFVHVIRINKLQYLSFICSILPIDVESFGGNFLKILRIT